MLIISRKEEKNKNIFFITLNRPEKINAINLEMLTLINDAIDTANADDDIASIIINSSSKNFCAGGDIVALYNFCISGKPEKAKQILEIEYKLIKKIKTNHKPIITIASGLVYGVGFGIFQAGHIRVADGSSKFAMPENLIGLYPDAVSGYFFQSIPYELARYMSITGSAISAENAVGLFDVNTSGVVPTLPSFMATSSTHLSTDEYIKYLKEQNLDEKTLQNIDYASPLSQLLADKHLTLCQNMTLDEVTTFESELSGKCTIFGDFLEGIRALLVDKDKKPKWKYSSLEKSRAGVSDFL